MLHHIVAKLVLASLHGVIEKVVDQVLYLASWTVLEHPLYNAASKAVTSRHCRSSRPRPDLVDNELRRLWTQGLNALLDDVVAMRAHDGLPDVSSKLVGYCKARLVAIGKHQRLLDCTAAIRSAGQNPCSTLHRQRRAFIDCFLLSRTGLFNGTAWPNGAGQNPRLALRRHKWDFVVTGNLLPRHVVGPVARRVVANEQINAWCRGNGRNLVHEIPVPGQFLAEATGSRGV
mmetsp:Transcript_25637/g.56541  ORF Transcript_25637/g.56541 Transcript_25637/m.56541 type:complete len:231 (+) Transcript_25637:492-1184(+)